MRLEIGKLFFCKAFVTILITIWLNETTFYIWQLALDMGDEIKYQNNFLRDMDHDFEKSTGFLGNSMRRVQKIALSGNHRHLLYLALFALVIFFLVYALIRFRWSKSCLTSILFTHSSRIRLRLTVFVQRAVVCITLFYFVLHFELLQSNFCIFWTFYLKNHFFCSYTIEKIVLHFA